MNRTSILVMVCLLSLASKAPAPIYGGFEDLNKLIDRAEFIVVAEIIKQPQVEEMDMGGGGTFQIKVIKAIKGDLKPDSRSTAYLRDLPFQINPPRQFAAITQGFIPGQRYLLFLNKPGGFHDENGKPLPVDFETENCEGASIWISSSGPGFFDLESLKGKTVRESVVALLNHTATEQQKFATAVKAMIESRGDRNVLTQKITQVAWLDKNAEEAAKFYLSIFKTSRKDPNINQYMQVGPSNSTFTGVRLWIDGQELVLLNGTSKFKPTEATALTLNCDLQEDIDYYWEKLSAGGAKYNAGWLKDKFGLWWHIIPANLPQLLGGKYGSVERVVKVLGTMDKIDSAALERAAHFDETSDHH